MPIDDLRQQIPSVGPSQSPTVALGDGQSPTPTGPCGRGTGSPPAPRCRTGGLGIPHTHRANVQSPPHACPVSLLHRSESCPSTTLVVLDRTYSGVAWEEASISSTTPSGSLAMNVMVWSTPMYDGLTRPVNHTGCGDALDFCYQQGRVGGDIKHPRTLEKWNICRLDRAPGACLCLCSQYPKQSRFLWICCNTVPSTTHPPAHGLLCVRNNHDALPPALPTPSHPNSALSMLLISSGGPPHRPGLRALHWLKRVDWNISPARYFWEESWTLVPTLAFS